MIGLWRGARHLFQLNLLSFCKNPHSCKARFQHSPLKYFYARHINMVKFIHQFYVYLSTTLQHTLSWTNLSPHERCLLLQFYYGRIASLSTDICGYYMYLYERRVTIFWLWYGFYWPILFQPNRAIYIASYGAHVQESRYIFLFFSILYTCMLSFEQGEFF